jgi:hypothetical protein
MGRFVRSVPRRRTPSYNSNASEHTWETIRGDRTPALAFPYSSAGFRRSMRWGFGVHSVYVSDVQLDLEIQRVWVWPSN